MGSDWLMASWEHEYWYVWPSERMAEMVQSVPLDWYMYDFPESGSEGRGPNWAVNESLISSEQVLPMLQPEEAMSSLPIEYTWIPEARRATSDFLLESLPELMALFVWTKIKEDKIPMMAKITRSSTKVKARFSIYIKIVF